MIYCKGVLWSGFKPPQLDYTFHILVYYVGANKMKKIHITTITTTPSQQ